MRVIGFSSTDDVQVLPALGADWATRVFTRDGAGILVAVWSTKREAEAHARAIRKALKMRGVPK